MKNKLFKIAFPCVLSLIISAAFIAGCSLSSYDWFVKTVKKHYFYPVDDSAFEGDDLKEIAGRTLDKYSAYYTAEEYKNLMKSNSGSKSGIGISYSFAEGKGIYISSVIGNSPAYISGLRAGEWIESASLGGETAVFEKSSDFADFVNSAKEEEKIKKGIYQMHVMVEGQCMDTLTEECEKGGKGTAGTKVKENQDTASQKEGAKTDPHTEMERMFAAGRRAAGMLNSKIQI